MKHAPIRHRLEYAAYWAVKTTLQRLPPRLSRALGRGMGRLAHGLLSKDRELARANLRRVLPALSEAEVHDTIRRAYRNYGDTLALSFLAGRDDAHWVRANVTVEGGEHLQAAKERGKGILLLSAHLGYWELSALRTGLEFGVFNIVYRPLDNPFLDRDVAALRKRFGIHLIPKSGAANPLLRALKRGEAVGLLPDQRVPAHQGIVVPFLGHPAITTSLPAALAHRTGCAVIPMFCLPDDAGGCLLRFGAPIDLTLEPQAPDASASSPSSSDAADSREAADSRSKSRDKLSAEQLAELTSRAMAPLEEGILAHPEFWLWAHRRWKLDS